MIFANALEVSRGVAEMIRPARKMFPSEAAALYLRNEKEPWTPALTPELVEPLEMMASRDYQGIVFVGPARTGKTFTLVLGAITYIVTCAPGDAMVVSMTADVARDLSRMDLDRAIRHSPELSKRLSPRPRDDNTYDKFFRSGMMLKIAWPSPTQLAGKTLKYVLMTDYDRSDDVNNVGGEGPMFDQGFKRIETFMSRGKCLAESSPNALHTADTINYRAPHPHEAPPLTGITELYNRGTRARLYWPCKSCNFYFQAAPGVEIFGLPPFKELQELVKGADLHAMAEDFAVVPCPECGQAHRVSDRLAMKQAAVWVHQGETLNSEGKKTGIRRKSNIASYWLGGVGASYQSWQSLIFKYLTAVNTYVTSGIEDPLKFTVNTDQAAVYLPRILAERRTAGPLRERMEAWHEGEVPEGVHFLIAMVDVQASRFQVLVLGVGHEMESWVVDWYAISASKRQEGSRFAALDPAAYLEDWQLIEDEIMAKEYVVPHIEGAVMKPVVTVCDSGGKKGVTSRAYEFWRKMKAKGRGKDFRLVKGDGRLSIPMISTIWPDAKERRDRNAGSKGDVPVLQINVNAAKDAVQVDLKREDLGPGFLHFPEWLADDFFDQVTSEIRNAKGIWEKNGPNEAADLMGYARALCHELKANKPTFWQHPPHWASLKRFDLAKAKEVAAQANAAPVVRKAPPARRSSSWWARHR